MYRLPLTVQEYAFGYFWWLFLLFHIDKPEGKHQIKQLVRVGQIRFQVLADTVQAVQKRAAVDKKFLSCLCGVLMVFQITAERLVERGLAVF